jgi:hypothetical protein
VSAPLSLWSALVIGLGVFATPARADEDEAETCIRTLMWSGYTEGWAVRTATTTTIGAGDHRVYLLSLFGGNEYRVQVCGDSSASDVDLVLHDADGVEISRDGDDGPRPSLRFKVEKTAPYYLAVHAADMNAGATGAGIAMAVSYR